MGSWDIGGYVAIPRRLVGKEVTKAEVEEYLGFGPHGV
jgi:hypothetical protein